jgi:hypothetical protein
MSRSHFAHLAPLGTVVALAALAVGGAAPAQGASFTVNATHDACTLRAAELMDSLRSAGTRQPTATWTVVSSIESFMWTPLN